MTTEPGSGRHRPPGQTGPTGVRSMSMIGSVGILAIVVALAIWGGIALFSSRDTAPATPPLGPGRPVASQPPAESSTSRPTPSEPTQPTGQPATPPPSNPVGPTGPGGVRTDAVAVVAFTCRAVDGRVEASLTFTSAIPVTAVLRAGDGITVRAAEGPVTLTVSGLPRPADCWAVIDGRTIGTIPAT